MGPAKTILHQLLAKIAGPRLHKGIEALHSASTTGVFPTRPHQKEIVEFCADKLLCQLPTLQHLINRDSEVGRLFLYSIAEFSTSFGCIHHIKPEDVFMSFHTHVEAIPVFWSFYQIVTALQRDPWRGRQARRSRYAC